MMTVTNSNDVQYTARKFREADGSITLSLNEMDIVSNGETLLEAKASLAISILEYADEYFSKFELYFRAPNRRSHLPYVMKALIAKSPEEVMDWIQV